MSNLPAWVEASGTVAQAALAATQLYLGIRLQREKAGIQWAQDVQALTGHSNEELHRLISEDPLIAQIVGEAWEAAARTANEAKRLMLARIVAAVFDGDLDDVDLDPIPLLLRAVEMLEGPHIRLLAIVALPQPGAGKLRGTLLEGAWTLEDLRGKWRGAGDLIEPLLAGLEKDGLVENVGSGTWDGEAAWEIRSFGRRLIHFLPDIAQDQLGNAQLVAVQTLPEFIAIRNLGPAVAKQVAIEFIRTRDGHTTVLQDTQAIDLAPGAMWRMNAWPPEIPSGRGPYRVTLAWHDDQGPQQAVRKLGSEPEK